MKGILTSPLWYMTQLSSFRGSRSLLQFINRVSWFLWRNALPCILIDFTLIALRWSHTFSGWFEIHALCIVARFIRDIVIFFGTLYAHTNATIDRDTRATTDREEFLRLNLYGGWNMGLWSDGFEFIYSLNFSWDFADPRKSNILWKSFWFVLRNWLRGFTLLVIEGFLLNGVEDFWDLFWCLWFTKVWFLMNLIFLFKRVNWIKLINMLDFSFILTIWWGFIFIFDILNFYRLGSFIVMWERWFVDNYALTVGIFITNSFIQLIGNISTLPLICHFFLKFMVHVLLCLSITFDITLCGAVRICIFKPLSRLEISFSAWLKRNVIRLHSFWLFRESNRLHNTLSFPGYFRCTRLEFIFVALNLTSMSSHCTASALNILIIHLWRALWWKDGVCGRSRFFNVNLLVFSYGRLCILFFFYLLR